MAVNDQMPILYRRRTAAELRKHRRQARWLALGAVLTYIAMAAVGGPY